MFALIVECWLIASPFMLIYAVACWLVSRWLSDPVTK